MKMHINIQSACGYDAIKKNDLPRYHAEELQPAVFFREMGTFDWAQKLYSPVMA